MLKFHAHDTQNDVAIIETQFDIVVRYGLQNESFGKNGMHEALKAYAACVQHAIECAGDF